MNTDQIYIDTLKDQIKSGIYDHLFEGKSDLVFLDIGANIGLVSIYAVPYCKRIVAVEPCKETFQRLQENTKNYPMISCDRHALASKDENVGFYINDINFTASSTVNTYGKFEPNYVMGATLSTLLRAWSLDHVDVCKIDVEGEEGRALTFDELSKVAPIIDTFFIEMHNCPFTDWQHKLGTIVSYLARLGYEKQDICGMALTATKLK
jgi:FkbM family methyltransferase